MDSPTPTAAIAGPAGEAVPAGTAASAGTRRRRRLTLLKLAFGLLVFAAILVASRTSLRDLGRVLAGLDARWLAVAFALNAVGLFASAYRWKILADAQGDVMPLGFLARSYLVGTFFSQFLPSSFGGDVVRIWDGSRCSRSVLKSSAIVAVERATGVFVLFVFALTASLFRVRMVSRVPLIAAALAVGAAGVLAAALFLGPPGGRLVARLPAAGIAGKLRDGAARFRATILRYREAPRPFLRATAWAVVLQVNVVVYYVLIGRAFPLKVPLLDYFMFIPIVLLVQILPLSINGIGLRELAYVAVFSYYGIAAQTAIAFSLIDAGLRLGTALVGGIVYLTRK